MAYYNLKTNEIWADSNIDGFLDDCVEIDEVIVPLIRELNMRGYRTKFCCSGHPFCSCNELYTDIADAKTVFSDAISVEKTDEAELPYRVITAPREDDFYIAFESRQKENIQLPLPDGFVWDDDDTIRYIYINNEFYAFLDERREAAQALHKWVLQLPKIK